VDALRLCAANSLPTLNPGKPSDDSCRTSGVAVGSIETAERIGKTRSMEPGLSAVLGPLECCEGVGDDARWPDCRPVNMDTVASVGVKRPFVGGAVWMAGRFGKREPSADMVGRGRS
jgi:hypothetical protein